MAENTYFAEDESGKGIAIPGSFLRTMGKVMKEKGQKLPEGHKWAPELTEGYKEGFKKKEESEGGKVSHKKPKYGMFDNDTIRRLG